MDPGEKHLATDFLFGRVDKGADAPPPRVRGVRLDRLIGEGAFGVVWFGEQFEPVTRPVAVKILRMASLGTAAVRRFEAEKIALARLEHPHIAHILDAGSTADGSPYLVMEYVEGVSLDEWCARRRDDTRALIRMFVQVARAIGYAHRQGILHRDLKPANVLVRTARGAGGEVDEPKVIDFGVAKLVGFEALRTETRQGPAAATPAYMSPEIASGSVEIDGRVDVWSLGVMIHEAIVGQRPFRTEREGLSGALELQRQIVEDRVRRPSAVLPPGASRTLRTALEDELDWIIMRALAKSPSERYTTPDELADDLERWLSGGNVQARPSTAGYRLRKLARRHKAALTVAGTLFAALAIAVAGLTYGLFESRQQAARWRRIADLNRSMLTALDPGFAQGLDASLMRLTLVEAEYALAQDETDPIVEAEIRSALGAAYASIGEHDEAVRQYGRERMLRIGGGAAEGDASIRSIDNAIGRAFVEVGNTDAAREPLLKASRGKDLIAANAVQNLAALAARLGDLERADELLREAMDRKRSIPGVPPASIQGARQEWALVLAQRGRYADAEPIVRELYAQQLKERGERHPSTLRAANNLAEVLLALGKPAEARALLESAIGRLSEVLGDAHADTLSARNNLAQALLELGEAAAATDLYRANRDAFLERYGMDDPRSILAGANLAQCLAMERAWEDAEREFRTTADRALRALGSDHAVTLANDANFGAYLVERERWAEAVVVLERASPLIERELGRRHPQCLAARAALARACVGLGQASRALEVLDDAESIAARGQPLNRIEKRAVGIAHHAAQEAGRLELAERLGAALEAGHAGQ
ncbi:MAG: Serine/threonine-protein kinase PknB [Planctomycetota bacterium]